MVRRTPADTCLVEQCGGAKDIRLPNIRPSGERQVVGTMDEYVDAVQDVGGSHRVQVKGSVAGVRNRGPHQPPDAEASRTKGCDQERTPDSHWRPLWQRSADRSKLVNSHDSVLVMRGSRAIRWRYGGRWP